MCWETEIMESQLYRPNFYEDFPRFYGIFPAWSSAKNPPHLLHRHRSAFTRPSIPSVEKNATPISKSNTSHIWNLLERSGKLAHRWRRKQENIKGKRLSHYIKKVSLR